MREEVIREEALKRKEGTVRVIIPGDKRRPSPVEWYVRGEKRIYERERL